MATTKAYMWRMPEDIRAHLEAEARRHGVTVNQILEKMCRVMLGLPKNDPILDNLLARVRGPMRRAVAEVFPEARVEIGPVTFGGREVQK